MEHERICVVTGSASGIGRATREHLERSGTRVIGIDRRDAELVLDLADPKDRAALAEGVAGLTGGRLDAVVAAAGLGGTGPDIIRVNFFGAVATMAGLRPLLARSAAPRVVAIASIGVTAEIDPATVDACLAHDEEAAVRAATEHSELAYTSSKRALARWVRRRAPTPDWAGAGITLNAVGPGLVATPMTQALLEDPVIRGELLARMPQPLGWPATPEQIAPVIAFLASAESSMTTGQCLFVDGGLDALRRGDDIWS